MKAILFASLILLSLTAYGQTAKPFKHAVTITFAAHATDAQIQEVDNSFQSLTKLAVVKGYEWGKVIDPKDPSKKQHVYIFTFDRESDLPIYGQSKEHLAHIKVGADITIGVSALDYFVQ